MANPRLVQFHFPLACSIKLLASKSKSLNYTFEAKTYELKDVKAIILNPNIDIKKDSPRTAWEWPDPNPKKPAVKIKEKKERGTLYNRVNHQTISGDNETTNIAAIVKDMLKDAQASNSTITQDEIETLIVLASHDHTYRPQQGGIFSAHQTALILIFIIYNFHSSQDKMYIVKKPDPNHLNVLCDLALSFRDIQDEIPVQTGESYFNYQIERNDDTFTPRVDPNKQEIWIPESVWKLALKRAHEKLEKTQFNDETELAAFIPLLADPVFLDAFLKKFEHQSEERWEKAREYIGLCFANTPIQQQINFELFNRRLFHKGITFYPAGILAQTDFSPEHLVVIIPFLLKGGHPEFTTDFLKKYKKQSYAKRMLAKIYIEFYFGEKVSHKVRQALSKSHPVLNFLDYVALPVSWAFRNVFKSVFRLAINRWGKDDAGFKRAAYLGYGLGILSAVITAAALLTAIYFAAPLVAQFFVGSAIGSGITTLATKIGTAAEFIYTAATVWCLSALNTVSRGIYKACVAYNKKNKAREKSNPSDPSVAPFKPFDNSKQRVKESKRKQQTLSATLFNSESAGSTFGILKVTANERDEEQETTSDPVKPPGESDPVLHLDDSDHEGSASPTKTTPAGSDEESDKESDEEQGAAPPRRPNGKR